MEENQVDLKKHINNRITSYNMYSSINKVRPLMGRVIFKNKVANIVI